MSVIPGFSSQRSNVFDPLSLDLWDPLYRCPFLKDLLSGNLPSTESDSSSYKSEMPAPVDWKETAAAHVFKADLPGLRKEEVKVEVEDGSVLQISGERRKDEEAEEGKKSTTDTWHRVERRSGRFMRRFRLPENAKVEEVRAEMENGVLTVTVPKAEVKKPAVKTIEISG